MPNTHFEEIKQIIAMDLSSIRSRLAEIIKEKSIKIAPKDEPFILASGKKSNYYINGKLTAGDAEGVYCIARLLLEEARKLGVEAIGGPTLGADPIVGAISAVSYIMGHPLPLFIVRKEAKQHGAKKMVEGPDISGKKVMMIEDVITTGGSVIKAINAVRDMGCEILQTTCLVDREQGGKEAFEKENIPYAPLFFISELLPAEILNEMKDN